MNSRSKGKRGEREVVALLQATVDKVCQSLSVASFRLERNLLQAHSGGCDIYGLDWLALEVKRQERVNIQAWWRQTLKQAKRRDGSQTPVLLWRSNHQPWRVRMRAPLRAGRRGAVHVTSTVDMSLTSFLVYFEERLRYELLMRGK